MLVWKRMGASSAGGAVLSVPFLRMAATDLYDRAFEQQRAGTSGIDAFLAVALDQPENADGRAGCLRTGQGGAAVPQADEPPLHRCSPGRSRSSLADSILRS